MTSFCASCSVSNNSTDFFCSNCGFDIVTGTIRADQPKVQESVVEVPVVEEDIVQEVIVQEGLVDVVDLQPEKVEILEEPAPLLDPEVKTQIEKARISIAVSYSREFFDVVVAGGEVDFPATNLEETRINFSQSLVEVGRLDTKRGVSPDLDLSSVTGDSAVSVKHCTISLSSQGELSLTDHGSTNGTYLELDPATPIDSHVQKTISFGQPIYVGAWTQIIVNRAE